MFEEHIRSYGLSFGPSLWTETRSRSELRHKLRMAQDNRTVLLLGGGDGVGGLSCIAIAIAIAALNRDEVGLSGGQLVVVRGKNEKL